MVELPKIERIDLSRPEQPPADSKVSADDQLTDPIGVHLVENGFSILFGTGYATSADKLLSRIPKSLDVVIVEHADPDHYGAVTQLRENLNDVTIAAPIGEKESFQKVDIQVDVYMEDEQTYWGFEAIEIPGHTPGNMSFLSLDHSILVVGDSFISSDNPLRASGTWTGEFAPIAREWCTDFDAACVNLRKLKDKSIEKALLTHGDDVTEQAEMEVEKLLSDLSDNGLV